MQEVATKFSHLILLCMSEHVLALCEFELTLSSAHFIGEETFILFGR